MKAWLDQHPETRARLGLESASYSFAIVDTLLCEHVAVRIKTDHPRRADVRITLLSPQGTRSVLQRLNHDKSAGPADWTYYSTQHFYESSAGTWRVDVSDEAAGSAGSVTFASVTISGVRIADADRDGLDDGWEIGRFTALADPLAPGPQDDPDGDGFSNMREQILGTDPLAVDVPLEMDLSVWDPKLARLSWPGRTNLNYRLWSGTNAATPLTLLTNLPGSFPEVEFFTPLTNALRRFFRVEAVPPP